MDETSNLKSTIKEVNQLRDLGMWKSLENYFVDEPFIDEQELTKELPSRVGARQLISSWRQELKSYFYATRHNMRNFRVKRVAKTIAVVETENSDQFYINDRGSKYLLTVVGAYTYNLVKQKDRWKIGEIKYKIINQDLKPLSPSFV